MRSISSLPLTALLSHVFVAFTIEFDNEAELALQHRTTRGKSKTGPGPWLVSMVMWFNCMRFVDENGIRIADLEKVVRTRTNLHGMNRWGYVRVDLKAAKRDAIMRATASGMRAKQVWEPMFATIEERWQERFGDKRIGALRQVLTEIVSEFDYEMPDCLPILGPGLVGAPVRLSKRTEEASTNVAELPLPALLSKPLLAMSLMFERESKVSLAICANVLRVVPDEGILMKDLPALSGVSKEAVATAVSYLQRNGLAVAEKDPVGGKFKLLKLLSKGQAAKEEYLPLLSTIEERWRKRFGSSNMDALRSALEAIVEDPGLFQSLIPHPSNWRAMVPRSTALPHFPMVLHRGGYPDGS
jgi:DNA-binding MarR family transcriptional regulator